jgi:hypothetical protein
MRPAKELGLEIPPGLLEYASARHRIEAAKEIRQVAAGSSPESRPESEKFIITINLGEGHVERYEKAMKIDALDGGDPNKLISLEGKPDVDK